MPVAMFRRPYTIGRRTIALIVGEEQRDGSDGEQEDDSSHDDSDPLRQERRPLGRFPLTAPFVFLPAAAGAGIVATCLRRFHDHPTASHPHSATWRGAESTKWGIGLLLASVLIAMAQGPTSRRLHHPQIPDHVTGPRKPRRRPAQPGTGDGRRHPGGTRLRRWAHPQPVVGAGLLSRIHPKIKRQASPACSACLTSR